MSNKLITFEQFKMLGNKVKGFVDSQISNLAGLTSTAISELKTGKQDKLTGKEGQVVGFNSSGNVVNFNGPINENFIDNPDFKVNQRKKTEYVTGYSVDRWKVSGNGSQKLTLENDGVVLTSTAGYGAYFVHLLDPDLVKALIGKTVTLSILAETNGADFGISILYNDNKWLNGASLANISKVYTVTVVIPMDATAVKVQLNANAAGSCKAKAVKLELGDRQTLAHQDSSGNWVLNEIPNYALELAKCQRYFISGDGLWTYGASVEGGGFFVTIPAVMRAKPTAIFSNGGSQVYIGGSWHDLVFREALYFQSMIIDIFEQPSSSISIGNVYLIKNLPDLSSDL